MSKLQHSPGPWKATGNGVHVGIDCIATTHADIKEQRIIDARLIAAAPDMLRLLRQIVSHPDPYCRTETGYATWWNGIGQAEALIARLDGGE